MIDKKLALLLLSKRHSYAQIGKVFGVSRQRIHQILTGYKTKRYKSKRLKKRMAKGCKVCGEDAFGIHHIDRNPGNNHPDNLMPICMKCHYLLHLSENGRKALKYKPQRKRWSRYYVKCNICGDNQRRHFARGLCSRCYQLYWHRQLKERIS